MLVLQSIIQYLISIILTGTCIVLGCVVGSRLRKRKNEKMPETNKYNEI